MVVLSDARWATYTVRLVTPVSHQPPALPPNRFRAIEWE